MATHLMILVDGYRTVEAWTAPLQRFESGGGEIVTQQMTDALTDLLDDVEAQGSAGLADVIAHEQPPGPDLALRSRSGPG